MVTWLHWFGVCRKVVLRQKSATEQNLLQGQREENGEGEKMEREGKEGSKGEGGNFKFSMPLQVHVSHPKTSQQT